MKGIALVSSGIDSPVAAYLMKKQGMEILPLFFINSTEKEIEFVKNILKQIAIKKLIVIDHRKNQKEFLSKCTTKYQCLLCKRLMYRIAYKLMDLYKCDYLITGENLSQVASQTLENMHVLSESIDVDVIRPILCFDKIETIKIAREIGTFDLSIRKADKCPYVPKNPVTKSTVENIKKEEAKVDIKKMIETTMIDKKIVEF